MGNCVRCKCVDDKQFESDHVSDTFKKIALLQAFYRGFIYRKNNSNAVKGKKSLRFTRFSLDTNFLYEDKFKSPGKRKPSNRTSHSRKSILNCIYLGKYDENGYRTGLGKLINPDLWVFLGIFKDNFMCGFGIKESKNGEVYKGTWMDDKPHGIGTYIEEDGTVYKGYWDMDYQSKFGIETWKQGNFYTGEYKKGDKNGIGILKFDENTYYEGEFKDNDMSGFGMFHFADNKVYQGEWKKSKMHGYGIMYYPDGKVYEGSFVEEKKEGFGIYYTDSRVFIGNWADDKLNGEGIILEKGKMKKFKFIKSKPDTMLASSYKTIYDDLANEIMTRHFKTKSGN